MLTRAGRQKTGRALDVDSINRIKDRLLLNRDDTVEGTFVYRLWEKSYFDELLCENLAEDFEKLTRSGHLDTSMTELANWIVYGVNLSLKAHHDPKDRSKIKNYSPTLERRWVSLWEPRLREVIAWKRDS